jgi:hypothetical protein
MLRLALSTYAPVHDEQPADDDNEKIAAETTSVGRSNDYASVKNDSAAITEADRLCGK